ncbi:MAG: hypothetical protein MZV63_62760 [Marinilabiliales bacterium]|nr:hypothetical protein [Marinilabiliales bacterium]
MIFVGFIVYDIIGGKLFTDTLLSSRHTLLKRRRLHGTGSGIEFTDGKLKAIAVTADGKIVAGGAGFPFPARQLTRTANGQINPGADITAIAVAEKCNTCCRQ